MNPYNVNPSELLTYLYRRFIILVSKLLSRKGVVFATATILLSKGIISDEVWQFTTALIIVDMGGQAVAQIFRPKNY